MFNKIFESIDEMTAHIAKCENENLVDDKIEAVWKALEKAAYFEALTNTAKGDDLTNAEFRKMLEQFPDDALISVECCNPRKLVYDEKYNLIRID